jgi:hypothetical protein
LNGDFGLSLADVIDDATRSRFDTEFIAVGKFPQLANAHEWGFSSCITGQNPAHRDKENQRIFTDGNQFTS